VLNKFLSGTANRVQIGDASTVFWADASDADASDAEAAELAEGSFLAFLTSVDENVQSAKIGTILAKIHNGERLRDFDPGLADPNVRFYVLGLAPNAARISVRFWLESDFGTLVDRYQRFLKDVEIAPPPREGYPPLWRYLIETAVLGKRENISPNLAGEWMRAILAGTHYPLTLLSSTLMRLRSDKQVNAYRVAVLKAVLARNFEMENTPVGLDLENRDKGYLLGRLFAVYEQIQSAALGGHVNATIKDKFYGSASAQPRKVFALLEKSSANHLAKLGKQAPGYRVMLEKDVAAIMEAMSPAENPFPAALSAQEQALFGLGYYHQRSEFFKPRKAAAQEEISQ
jgi:CRISPR-associated protein Csd1